MTATADVPNTTNDEIIRRYTDQPGRMPPDVRDRIERLWNGRPVQLYALADLDVSLRLVQRWVALGPDQVAIAEGDAGKIRAIERGRIREVRETPGLSCNTLTLLGDPDEPALAVLRYTHRQRRAMENLKFVLEQQIEGVAVDHDEPDAVYADAVAYPVRDAQASVAGHKLAVVWRLLGYLRPYRGRVVAGMSAACLMTLLHLVPPSLTGHLIREIVEPYQRGTLSPEAAWRGAWFVLAALAGVIVFREVFAYVRLRTMAVLGEHVAHDLRNSLYNHLQTLSLSYFSRKQTGSIISRVSSDTDRLWDFIAFGVVEVSLAVIMLFGLAGVLIWHNWMLGLLMTVPVPAFMWAIFNHGRIMQRIFLRAWRRWSDLTDVLANTIPGMRVVKAFNQEEQEKRRFSGRNVSALESFNDIHYSWTRFWPMLMAGIHSTMLAVWFFALPMLLSGGPGEAPRLDIGTFVTFMLYLGMFFYPIETIGQMSRMLNRAVSSAHRIFEVLDTEPEIVDPREPVRLEPVGGHVAFDNVSFAYDGVRQVLRGVSFEVQPGEMIGLVGPSGAGKTTVINLIARFYDVTGGAVRIDGIDLRDLDAGHFRRQVGMVLQDPYLFHGTVLDNIRYGNPEAAPEAVIDAARAANAHDFVCRLPHGYDTLVGERGHTLSGGERQRVSIARAILSEPRILILDEATSSVDTETERKIQEALDRLIPGRTVFAIAHRLSTLRRATRIFVIEDGRVTETGTHEELLANAEGTYRKLYSMQRELHEQYAV